MNGICFSRRSAGTTVFIQFFVALLIIETYSECIFDQASIQTPLTIHLPSLKNKRDTSQNTNFTSLRLFADLSGLNHDTLSSYDAFRLEEIVAQVFSKAENIFSGIPVKISMSNNLF